MKQKDILKVIVNKKENILESILEQIDNYRFETGNDVKEINIVVESINLNIKEMYCLFNELVIENKLIINNIEFIDKNEDLFKAKNTFIFIGDTDKNSIISCDGNIKIIGTARGTIILNNKDSFIYAAYFDDCNVIYNNKTEIITNKKDYIYTIK